MIEETENNTLQKIEEKDHSNDLDHMLTSKEVASKLRIGMTALYMARRNKTGPNCKKVGHHYLYPLKDLINYINKSGKN